MKRKNDQLKTGIILSYLQMFLSILIGLLYTPVMLRLLGKSEYGLYSTVSSTISMLTILNLGFNSSYIRYYARFKARDEREPIYKLNGLFLIVFLIIGAVALLCGIFLTFRLQLLFKEGLTVAEYGIARVLTLLLTVDLAVSFPMSVFQTIIFANEKFTFLKLLGMVKTVIGPLVTLPLLLMGYRSIAMVCATVSISLFVDICYFFYVIVVLKMKFIFHGFEKGLMKSLLKYSVFIAVNTVIDQINWNIDKILLGRFKGTTAVSIYTVGYSLQTYYQTFSSSISGIFTTRIHKIFNACKNDVELLNAKLSELFIKVGRIQFLILGLVGSGFCLFGKKFIYFWAGDGYEESYYVALLLILSSSIALIQNIGIEVQRAENRHQFRSIAYSVMAVVNLVLSVFLCQKYGAVGSVIGTALSLVLANGLIMNIYYYRKCGLDIISFWKEIMRMAIGLIAPVLFGCVLNHFAEYPTLWNLCAGIIVYVVAYCISMWLISMNAYEKDLVKKTLTKIFSKFFRRKA